MGAVRRPQYVSSRADADWRIAKAQITKSQKSLAGFIFYCDDSTFPDLKRNIFGLPERFKDSVRCIREGMPLFLFNRTDGYFYGVFEAASDGGFNIDPQAWENTDGHRGRRGQPGSRYPAQVRVRMRDQRPQLDEDTVRPILDYQFGTFKLDLTGHQVQQLLCLFGASTSLERELRAGGRIRQNCSIGATAFRDPESPRLICKSDSEYFSDCSSRGMNSGEDDWPEERAVEKADYQQEEEERMRLSHVSLTDSMTYANGHIEMPGPLNDQPTGCCYNSEEPWKESFQGGPHCAGLEYDSRVVLRLRENDPAVNSNSSAHTQEGVDRSILVNGTVNLLAMPMLPSEVTIPFTGTEKMFWIPVKTVKCRQRENDPYATQSEATEWSNQRRTSRVLPISSHKLGLNQHVPKDARYLNQHVPLDSLQSSNMRPQELQMNKVLFPFRTQGPGHFGDQGRVATVLPPMFMPSNGAVPFTQPQMGGREDESNEGFESASDVHMLPEQLQQLLQSRQGQIMLVPPQILSRPAPPVRPARPITVELLVALHSEILQFARRSRPSPEIQKHVEAAIDCVRRGVKLVWPEADVEVFGSFATGLCLQHSDVDLAVVDAPQLPGSDSLTIAQVSATLIRKLAAGLKEHEWCESIKPLDMASMPVLKCLCRPFGASSSTHAIAVDITIGGMRNPSCPVQAARPGKFITRHTGGAARDYVLQKIRELPALAPLVLLLKSFLHHKGLSNVYTGGLGSFSLTLLVAFFLEKIPSPGGCVDGRTNVSPTSPSSSPLSCSSEFSDDSDAPSSSSGFGATTSNSASESTQSLGELFVRQAAGTVKRVLSHWVRPTSELGALLIGFLETFGCIRDLSREKIVLKGADGSPGGFFDRDDRHVALWIDDPLRPGVNIGAGSFCMVHVQNAFKQMLQVLINYSDVLVSLDCEDKGCQDLSHMSRLQHLKQLLKEPEQFQLDSANTDDNWVSV